MQQSTNVFPYTILEFFRQRQENIWAKSGILGQRQGNIGSVVELLKRRDYDQHGLG